MTIMDTKRILLVEDDPNFCRLVRRMLEKRKPQYEFVEADSLEQGLKILTAGFVDLVLLDLNLHDSAGMETFQKAYERAPDVPIIVLTSTQDEFMAETMVQLGAQDYLFKTALRGDLLERSIRYAITRKQAEKESAAARGMLEAAVAQSPSGILIADAPGGAIRMVNRAARKIQAGEGMEAVSSGDIHKKEAWKFFKPGGDPYPFEELPLTRALKMGEVTTNEELILRDERGEDHWIRANAAPIRDGRGHVTAGVLEFQDITRQKRTEQALERRILALTRPTEHSGELAFEDLFNLRDIQHLQDLFAQSAGVASIITRTDGTPITKPSNFCRLCNDIIRQTKKGQANCYKSDSVIGRHHPDGPIVQPCLSGGLWDAGASITLGGHHIANWLIGQVRDATQTEENMAAYAREIGADEEVFLEAFRQVPAMSLKQFNRVAETLFTLANQLSTLAYQNVQQAQFITFRKQVEEEREKLKEQYRQSQKMEAIGTLAGGIAHDFNNILGAIMGFTELSYAMAPGEGPFKHNLSQVITATNRAADLVKQILTFSRQREKERVLVEMEPLVRESLTLLEASSPSYIEKKVTMEKDLGMVKADPGQLQQVLMNLYTNACHAMEEKGGLLEIRLESSDIRPNSAESGQGLVAAPHICLTVKDNGAGMEPEIREKIFDPYFTTKEVDKGTGLGLAVVHGIIKSHRGAIFVDSSPGEGTEVRVFLPCVAMPDPVETFIPSASLQGGQERVLLVEDEDMLAQVSRDVLETFGYQVARKTNGKEALELFQADPGAFDLVITDQTMPLMTGQDLAREILRLRPGLPVIMCTGYSEKIDSYKAGELGIRAFLLKPLSLEKLVKTVRQVLDE